MDIFANNVKQAQGALAVAINNTSLNIPAGAADTYFEIALPQPFNYSGVDNLVMELTRASACTEDFCVTHHGRFPCMG